MPSMVEKKVYCKSKESIAEAGTSGRIQSGHEHSHVRKEGRGEEEPVPEAER